MGNTAISADFISESLTKSGIASQLAKNDTNFVICGGNSTDMETLARTLHLNSPRNTQPFIPADCTALPEQFLEMDLFGYENADVKSMCRGLVEYADQGTLFLDEVCDLSLKLQEKLLKVLQGSTFRRVGGKTAIKVKLRIISVSAKNPVEAMASGQLRPDFFSQLNLIPL